jgi:hypothetical protein
VVAAPAVFDQCSSLEKKYNKEEKEDERISKREQRRGKKKKGEKEGERKRKEKANGKRRDGWQAGWKVRMLRGCYTAAILYCHLLLLISGVSSPPSGVHYLLSSLLGSDGDSGSSFR